jgi:adenine C2-methylase RlmN of 23S rRNA A2503 and tRNA A37
LTKKQKLTLEYIQKKTGITATLRTEQGHDIATAYSQLRLK